MAVVSKFVLSDLVTQVAWSRGIELLLLLFCQRVHGLLCPDEIMHTIILLIHHCNEYTCDQLSCTKSVINNKLQREEFKNFIAHFHVSSLLVIPRILTSFLRFLLVPVTSLCCLESCWSVFTNFIWTLKNEIFQTNN